MVKSMVSDTMSAFHYHLEFFGMLPYIITHHEEGSFNSIFVQ